MSLTNGTRWMLMQHLKSKYFISTSSYSATATYVKEIWEQKKQYKRNYKIKLDSHNIVSSPAPDLDLRLRPLHVHLWYGPAGLKYPHRTAIEDGLTGQKYTFHEGRTDSSKMAKIFQDLGLAQHDILVLFLPNCVEYPVLTAASSKIGMITSTMNPAFTPGEASRQFMLAKPKLVVTEDERLETIKEAIDKCDPSIRPKIISIDATAHKKLSPDLEVLSLPQLMSDCDSVEYKPAKFTPHLDDVAALPFSSGTTGVPKAVMLTHRQMVFNSQQITDAEEFDYRVPCTDDYQGSTICVLPMYHIFAFNGILSISMHNGDKVITLPKFDPNTYIDAIKKHKPDFLAVAPPLVGFMSDTPKLTAEDLASVRHLIVAAAPVGQALMDKMRRKMPDVMFVEGYGLTETGPAACLSPLANNVANSCGQPLPNTKMKVVCLETGQNLGVGERGEICIKGPQVMKGYFNNHEATSSCIKDGWFHSGDLGYFDEEGNFYIADRLKELIKVKGLQVPPAELEDVLRSHPLVADVAVIGVPHERFGEAPRAYIIRNKAGEDELTEQMVNDFMEKEVSTYKQLVGGIQFVESIPKSPAGKILRRELKEKYLETGV